MSQSTTPTQASLQTAPVQQHMGLTPIARQTTISGVQVATTQQSRKPTTSLDQQPTVHVLAGPGCSRCTHRRRYLDSLSQLHPLALGGIPTLHPLVRGLPLHLGCPSATPSLHPAVRGQPLHPGCPSATPSLHPAVSALPLHSCSLQPLLFSTPHGAQRDSCSGRWCTRARGQTALYTANHVGHVANGVWSEKTTIQGRFQEPRTIRTRSSIPERFGFRREMAVRGKTDRRQGKNEN